MKNSGERARRITLYIPSVISRIDKHLSFVRCVLGVFGFVCCVLCVRGVSYITCTVRLDAIKLFNVLLLYVCKCIKQKNTTQT